MNRSLSSVDWQALINPNDNVDDINNLIIDKILSLAALHIPVKVIRIRPNDKPWMTQEIRRNLRVKNRLLKKARSTNRENDWLKFRIARNDVIDLIRQAKQNYLNKLQNTLSDKSIPPGKWWRIAKSISNFSNKSSSSQPFKIGGNTIIHPMDKAEALNNFFCSISNSTAEVDDSDPDLPPLSHLNFSDINITDQDVLDQIDLIKLNMPAGPDNVSLTIIKNLAPSILTPLK